MEPLFRKGHIFQRPDHNEMYELTQDVYFGDLVMPNHLKPYNGAPKPMSGEFIQEWLLQQINGR